VKNPTYTTTDDRGNVTQVEVAEYKEGTKRVTEIQSYSYLDQARRKVIGFHPADKVTTIVEYSDAVKNINCITRNRLGYEPNVLCNIVQTREHFTFGVLDKKKRRLGIATTKTQIDFPDRTVWTIETSHTRNGLGFRASGWVAPQQHDSEESCNKELYSKLQSSLRKAANFGKQGGYQ
jgi:hypothetical protein